jgi:hypothetical protein
MAASVRLGASGGGGGSFCPLKRPRSEVSLSSARETGDAEELVQQRANHRDPEGAPGGLSAAELCRKHGISDATFYKGGPRFSAVWGCRTRRGCGRSMRRRQAEAAAVRCHARRLDAARDVRKTSDARFEEECRELGDQGRGTTRSAAPARRRGALRCTSPGPSALNRTTQSRTICSPTCRSAPRGNAGCGEWRALARGQSAARSSSRHAGS